METQIKENFKKFRKVASVEYGLLACFEEERGAKETLEALVSFLASISAPVAQSIHRTVVNISSSKYKECYLHKCGVCRNGRGCNYNISDITLRSRQIAKRGTLLSPLPPAVGEPVLEQDPSLSNSTTNT